MRPHDLHHKAHALVAANRDRARSEALDRLNALLGAGSEKATTRPDKIVKAARYSQVDTLFLSGDDHLWGTFDEANNRVVAHGSPVPGDIDLIDYVALMTLRNGGHIALIGVSVLPPGASVAAILRF